MILALTTPDFAPAITDRYRFAPYSHGQRTSLSAEAEEFPNYNARQFGD
jgi:hypothetical protein